MNKPRIHLLIGMVCLFLFACRKETSIENYVGPTANFVATIDGASWQAVPGTESVTIVAGLINITGINANNQEISMTLTGSGTGTYTLNQQTTSLAIYANIDSSFQYLYSTNQGQDTAQAGGQVTITQIDPVNKTVSGTFSFKGYRVIDGQQKTITQGRFTNLSFTGGPTGSGAQDTLTASIDNKGWQGTSIQAAVNAGVLTIIGSSGNAAQSIGLILPSNTPPGSYPLDGSNPSFTAVYTSLAGGATSGYVATQGTLTVRQNDMVGKRISGTFQFTAKDPTNPLAVHIVSTGVFSVYYGP